MIDAVFISDLHLNQHEPQILERFKAFIQWAAVNTRAVYILGDFLHAWAGDDTLDDWALSIVEELAFLTSKGLSVYFMAGNRDFLVGQDFARRAQLHYLTEPSVIMLGNERIVLVHGDQYCTQDKAHQWFRCLTRNQIFIGLFLQLPKKWRVRIVARVRQHSQTNPNKTWSNMAIVPKVLIRHLQKLHSHVVIHGHTHQPGLIVHEHKEGLYKEYILSDWDRNPSLLCYNKTKGFCYRQILTVDVES